MIYANKEKESVVSDLLEKEDYITWCNISTQIDELIGGEESSIHDSLYELIHQLINLGYSLGVKDTKESIKSYTDSI